jgi:OOP family OmpA-OmpF porin
VQSEVERSVLVDAATTAVGSGSVDDQLTVDPDTGLDADTTADLATLIDAMGAQLVSGIAAFDGVDLAVTGVFATNAQRNAVVAEAQRVGATVELERRPDATDDDAEDLEAEVNAFAAANPILFEPASAVLTDSGTDVVDAIARRLQQFDGVDVTVEGHTDSDGDAAANLTLSQQRADAVRDALVERGIAPASITAEGFGSERPVLVDGVEDKDASRRVEFRVVVSS